MFSKMLYFRNVEDAKAVNRRGDIVFAETDFHGGETHPSATVIWLRRSGHWFSTTLLKANSFEASVDMKWRDNDHLVLRLDFGSDGYRTAPVETVGPIHICYQFGSSGDTQKRDSQSSDHRDLPALSCD